MDTQDPNAIATAWLAVQRSWWAYDRLVTLVDKQPETALAVLESLVEQAESDDLLHDVGAGPLEDFVRAHGHRFVDRLEILAALDGRWRTAFRKVWIPDADDVLTHRLERLGCTQLRNRKAANDEDAAR